MDHRTDINFITDILRKDLNKALTNKNEFGRAVYLFPSGKVTDDTTKILIYDKDDTKVAVLICSKIKYSDLPLRSLKYSKQIRKTLDSETEKVILNPLIYGTKEDICYAVWPYHNPLSSNKILKRIQIFKLTPALFRWMRSSIQQTLQKPNSIELIKDFLTPLNNLINNVELDTKICDEISTTIKRLNDKTWQPYFAMAHNDLWSNNILIRGKKYDDFVIIDWAGGRTRSYAIYDLVRIFMDLNLSKKIFHKELKAHCRILRCEIEDSKSYLLSSLAYLGMNLEHFPEDDYLKLIKSCCSYLFFSLKNR